MALIMPKASGVEMKCATLRKCRIYMTLAPGEALSGGGAVYGYTIQAKQGQAASGGG